MSLNGEHHDDYVRWTHDYAPMPLGVSVLTIGATGGFTLVAAWVAKGLIANDDWLVAVPTGAVSVLFGAVTLAGAADLATRGWRSLRGPRPVHPIGGGRRE